MDSLYKSKRKRRIAIVVVILLSLFVVMPGASYLYIRKNIFRELDRNKTFLQETGENKLEDNDVTEAPILEEEKEPEKEFATEYDELKGITNILLIGVDARTLEEASRSDSMIILTIDSNNKKIKISSIMRDTYVSIRNHGSQKINAAYAYGGPELLLDTIEKNFRVKLDKYMVINFWGFEEVVNLLGGLDIDVKDYEVKEVNKYIGEIHEKKSPPLTGGGLQHLDGQQVLAYSRIRQAGNGSYERNQRQREVLSLIAGKVKEIKIYQYPQLMSKMIPYIKTNIEPVNFLNYAYTVSKFKPLEIGQLQMPMTEICDGRIFRGTWVFLMDKEQNAKVLYDFIFRDKITRPEELNLKAFRQKIRAYTEGEGKSNPTINQTLPDY